MIDNEFLIQKITKLLKDRQNNLFIGTITNPTLFSECNVIRDNDNLTVTAINLNCIFPGKVTVIKDIDDNKYYCFTNIENSIANTKNILYRKTNPININPGNYYKELRDLANTLNNKKIIIGKKTIVMNKKIKSITQLKDNTEKELKENTDKFETDYSLEEWSNYLVCYSDSCETYRRDTTKYYSFINQTTNKYELKNPIIQQPVNKIDSKTKYYVTNFSPFILYSFISNKDTKPNTDLSRFFTVPTESLKRNKKKYNPNFYYVWRLFESVSGSMNTYAYGWVNLDGLLKITNYNYELDPGCLLQANYVFHSENNYNGFMKIDIGGMDRTNLIFNRPSITGDTNSSNKYKGTVLFTRVTNQALFTYSRYFGNTSLTDNQSNWQNVIDSVNNDIYDPIN